MLYLRTFGGLSVETGGASATGAAQQRKTLALLALLAVAGRRGISRDKLLVYLWADSDAQHGRNRLKQACFALRRDLGAPRLFLGTFELRLNPDIITSDVQDFEDALDRGDPGHAVALYRGPFLDGFYLTEAGEFERWVEEERARWLKRVCEVSESLAAQAEAAGDANGVVRWWRRFTDLDRLSSRAALGLMNALVATGDRAAALEVGRAHEAVLRQVLGTCPDAAVTEVLERLRAVGTTLVGTGRGPEGSMGHLGSHMANARSLRPTPRVRKRLVLGAAAMALAGGVIVASSRRPASLDPELLAVVPFETIGPKLEPWREGLVHLLSRNLDGAIQLHTVPSTLASRRWEGRADPISAEDLGRRTGAGLVLFGELASVGADSVRLRAGVLDRQQARVLAEFERMEQADRIDRLADSLSLDVMRVLTPTTSPLYRRLVSPPTRSLPALKAFLQGETYRRRLWLDSAAASYERAIALDSTFALALHGLGVTRSWNLQPAQALGRAGELNRGLSRLDSLLVANDAPPSGMSHAQAVRWKEEVLIAAIEADPEDPEVWHQVGETQFHIGFAWPDSTWNRARRSFDGAILRDSGSAAHYVHPVELALDDNDPETALRYVRGYLAIPSVNPEGAGMRLLSLRLDPARARPRKFERGLDTASLSTLRRLGIALRWWPDSQETQIEVARRLLARARESFRGQPTDWVAYSLRLYESFLARTLIFRGRLAEARRFVGSRLAMAPFMELVRMGAMPADTVEVVLGRGVHGSDLGGHVIFPWLMEAPCVRTLDAALWWASRRDTVRLQGLVRSQEAAARARGSGDVDPYGHPVPAFTRAALALARGDTAAALERFRPDSACPGAQQPRDIQFQLLAAAGRDSEAAWVWERLYDRRVPLLLERARLADRLGDRPTAIHYYQFVRQAWLHADPELQPFVAEARAALVRLAGAPR